MILNLFRKMVVFFVAVLAVVPAGGAARADPPPLNFDLAQNHINITTGFTGSTLSVFGIRQGYGDIIVVLEGQPKDSIVRRRENVAGAWINRSWLRFKQVPVYYDYAHSGFGKDDFLSAGNMSSNHVGLDFFKSQMEKNRYDAETRKSFQDALVRNKQARGLFPSQPQKISFLDTNFFRVDFHLPSNVPRGRYLVRALLVRDGKIMYEVTHSMTVAQIGFSSDVYQLAHENPFIYGILCVLIASMAGWASNALVRRN